MAENLIPGLDGDLPSQREMLPDSLTVKKKANGSTAGYANQQNKEGSESSKAPHNQVYIILFNASHGTNNVQLFCPFKKLFSYTTVSLA